MLTNTLAVREETYAEECRFFVSTGAMLLRRWLARLAFVDLDFAVTNEPTLAIIKEP